MADTPFSTAVRQDYSGLLRCIRRDGEPERVHVIELFLDGEVQDEICRRYDVLEGLSEEDPFFECRKQIALQRFLGYDYVGATLDEIPISFRHTNVADTADLQREGGRAFLDEHTGPITTWEEFETFAWPDPTRITTRRLEWYEEHLPEDMCVIAVGGCGHFAEYLSWLMGYETLCFSLYDQRDLVAAIAERCLNLFRAVTERLLQFDRVKMIWGSDDMGFRTGPLISPADLREFVLPGHKALARMAHEAGRPYLLHSCGNLELITQDLIEDVGIDAKHSFEDTFETVMAAKQKYGHRIALLGGIDVDFLCRATAGQIRRRVRETLEACMTGGGYVLGTGNSVANYIPVDNYLTMLDEGRRFGA